MASFLFLIGFLFIWCNVSGSFGLIFILLGSFAYCPQIEIYRPHRVCPECNTEVIPRIDMRTKDTGYCPCCGAVMWRRERDEGIGNPGRICPPGTPPGALTASRRSILCWTTGTKPSIVRCAALCCGRNR
jgi:hypothetical protein